MQLVSYKVDGVHAFGVMVDGGVVALPKTSGIRSMREWIAAGLVGATALTRQRLEHTLSQIQLLSPVPDPAHIVGIGLNTKSHFEETAALKNRKPGDYPKYPRLFLRSADSLALPDEPMKLPKLSDTLDYEGEIGLVIGKKGRNIDPKNWRDYVVGLSCFNDGSVRGYQLHSDQVTAGKNFVASGAWGPSIVTLDAFNDLDAIELTVYVNGELRQHLTMDDLIFSWGELLAYVSQPFELQPGDVIATGSPEGIGALCGKYLKSGDLVTITLLEKNVGTVMTLINRVIED